MPPARAGTRSPPPPPATPPNDPEAGTTLVELLVALALFALMAVFIGEGIAALRRMAPVSARIDASAEVAIVRDHLRQAIGEALAELPAGGAAPFEGKADRLVLLGPGDPLLEVGGVARIVLSIEPGAGGFDLVERRRVERGSGTGAPTVLLRALAEARFSYAGPVEGTEPDWRKDWDEAGAPPALVRLDWTQQGSSRALAPLLVHPGTARPPGDAPPTMPPAEAEAATP